MKRICLLTLFALIVSSGIAPSRAEEPPGAPPVDYHGHLSAGIVRLNQNDLGGALSHFEEALSENPQGVEAFYYIGVVRARSGNLAEAEEELREALARDPAFLPAYFDLGVLYYQEERDREALQLFEVVQRADPGRARVYYYQGLILRRLARPQEAAEKMEKAASLDPELALEAKYHAGSAYFEARELEAARKSFEEVMTALPEGETARSAAEFLERIERQAKPVKRWDLLVSGGIQHDSNVILAPSGTIPSTAQAITNKSDLMALLFLRGRYQWLNTRDWVGRAEYNLYQNLHKESALRDFNIQNHQITVNGGWRYGALETLLQYDLQLALLGGNRYLFRQNIGPRLILQEDRKNLTEVAYQYGMKSFSDIEPLFPKNSDRDVTTHKLGLTHYYLFQANANLHGGYAIERENAGSGPTEDDWTFTGHRLSVGTTLPPWNRFTLALEMEYLLRQFANDNSQLPGNKRKDNEWLGIATLSRPLSDNVDVSFQYLRQQNDSNIPLFEYKRNIYGVVMAAKF
ncbi:MAG: tetratricopeptide repeat protein [Candidatus Manganitrophaceae bacterium]